ncbi:hypothetical protein MASR2M15_03290 [Anaerolineales bacterium]
MSRKDIARLDELLDFVLNAPQDEDIMAMDCNDYCEQMATLAERVANGESLQEVRPELEQYMQFWCDCREEFVALVSILKAEKSGDIMDPTDR